MKGIALLILFIEFVTSIQNSQSNALIAGLLVAAMGFMEKRKYLPAALLIVFSASVKIFGIAGLLLFLFYPYKWKSVLFTAISGVLVFSVPLAFISPGEYWSLFESYGRMLSNDHMVSYGYSVMGWLKSWFGIDLPKYIVVMVGTVLMLLPLLRIRLWQNLHFRLLTLSALLIWMVIFNHKAESPTFVLAMTGVAIWYVISEKNALNTGLLIFAFIFTTLSSTDLFPPFVRMEIVKPYALKALPCLLIWMKIIYDMIFMDRVSKPVSGRGI
jgi:hypothetical protein